MEPLVWASPELVKYQGNFHNVRLANMSRCSGELIGKPDQLRYSDFPTFEKRLRQLRHYIDSQESLTLWKLWKDKLDTLN
jgi:hypothetical protein